MKGKTAGLVFLGICAALAMLLFTSAISPLLSGAMFAGALILLGGLSLGFTRK